MSRVKQEKIQKHYDEVADRYDHHYDHSRGRSYHTHLSRHLMEVLPKNGLLLDIGCGTGLFVERYCMDHSTAIGLDISRGMILLWKISSGRNRSFNTLLRLQKPVLCLICC